MIPRRLSLLGLAPLLIALVAVAGCGKKGDPQPPIRSIPAPTTDLSAVQRDGDLLLDFAYPQTTAAGTPLTGLSEIAVWEMVWRVPAGTRAPTKVDARQFLAGARPVKVLEHDDVSAAIDGARVRLSLPVPPPPAALPTPAPAPATAATPAATPPAPSPEPAPEPAPTPAAGEAAAPTAAPAPAPAPTAPTGPGQAMVALAVKTQGPSGEESALSNLIVFPLQEAPEAPTGLGAEAGADGVTVSWSYPLPETPPEPESPAAGEPAAPAAVPSSASKATPEPAATAPEAPDTGAPASEAQAAETQAAAPAAPGSDTSEGGVTGFDVYRRLATEKHYGQPLRFVAARLRSFVDESAVFGQRYIYTVTAVSARRPVLVESPFAEEVEVDYRDRYPPPAPEGLVALYGEGRVRLVWKASPAPDLAGYKVYRRGPDTQEFRPLTSELVTATELVDRNLAAGASYTYQVTAVDRLGNESPPSEPATVQAR